MKKVLIISGVVGSGWLSGKAFGSQAFPQTIMGYAQNGWEVFLLAGYQARKDKRYSIDDNLHVFQFTKNSIRNLFLKLKPDFIFRNLWWIYFQFASFFPAFLIAKREKVDLIYGYEINAIPVARLLSVFFKKPVVFRYQGTKIPLYKKQRFWKLRYFTHVLAMRLKANLYIMANDGTTGEAVLKDLGVPQSKIKFWLNGVDKSIFEKAEGDNVKEELGISEEDKIIMSVSRVEKWKRIDRTIRALPEILEKNPSVCFVVVGEGKEKKILEKMAKDLEVEENVKFLGMIEHQKLKKYYKICDVFISMYDLSNVGNPLLEAMAQGKCIVALDVGDTNKFIKNNKNGILVKEEQLQNLSEILISLLDNRKRREFLANNAREFSKNKLWSWEERMEAEIQESEKLVKR